MDRKTKGRRDRAGDGAGELAGDTETGAGAGASDGEGSAIPHANDAGAGPDHNAERVGSIAVDVDRPALLEEAAAIAASSPSSAPAIAVEAPAIDPAVEKVAEDVKPVVRLLVAQTCSTFAPAWAVDESESNGVADALALTLAYWVPLGALEPKYLVLLGLATSIYGVAHQRRLPDGGFMPLRAPRATRSSKNSPAPSPAPAGGNVTPLHV